MEKMKVFNSVVNEKIMDEIEEASWCTDLIQYATYRCKIDGMIASAYLFCPTIIQVRDYIFIEKFWDCDTEESLEQIVQLEEKYCNDKKAIEMSVNTWSIGDFFVGEDSNLMNNEKVIEQFGQILVHFWKLRAKELFPEREIIVELGNELMGELGLCITMYEKN